MFLLISITLILPVYSAETAIKVTPKKEYSTCKPYPKEGDYIEFVTIEENSKIPKGSIVEGLLTERIENDFEGKVGSFYIEQFKINGKKLNGIIYQKGNPHALFLDNVLSSMWVRGGEAFLKPNKQIFTLYLEE